MQNHSAFWAVKSEILTSVSVSRPSPLPQCCPLGIWKSSCTGWRVSDAVSVVVEAATYKCIGTVLSGVPAGLPSEAWPVSQEHLPRTVPACSPQKSLDTNQVHRGRHVSQLLCRKPLCIWVSVSLPLSNVCIIMFGFFVCLFCFIYRQKGKKPFKSLRNLKIDLDLTAEGDLNIIMALAEKIKPGLHSFIFGRPFYTSVQERDVLMTF